MSRLILLAVLASSATALRPIQLRPSPRRTSLVASATKPLFPEPALAAEALGTGLITLLGTGTVCAAVFTGAQQGIWQIAAAWGAAVAIAAYTTAGVSGAHLNPAVTFALVVFKGFPPRRALAYVFAQVVGASGAALLNFLAYSRAI
eukprot:3251521-Prymnesium_polylepis.1